MLPVCDMSLAGVIPGGDAGPLWSDSVSWTDLTVPVSVAEGAAGLDLDGNWHRRWLVSWKAGRSH